MFAAHRGFSLIETLAVTAVIASLVAIGIGAYASSADRAREAKALVQMKRLGLAAHLYTAESGGKFPGSQHNKDSWVGGLLPYFDLGDNPSVDRMKSVYRSPGDPHPTRLYSYAINDLLLPNPAGARHLNYSRIASVARPSQTLLFAETRESYRNSDHFHFAYGISAAGFKSAVAVDRYRGGGLYLFADAHVERLTWDDAQKIIRQPGSTFVHPGGN